MVRGGRWQLRGEGGVRTDISSITGMRRQRSSVGDQTSKAEGQGEGGLYSSRTQKRVE
jgi:hypothetical protein